MSGTQHEPPDGLLPDTGVPTPQVGTVLYDRVDFAPTDPTDGRAEYDWRSRYTDRRCRVQILLEGVYLALTLVVVATFVLLVWLGEPRELLGVNHTRYLTFTTYAYAWLSGTLGGALFAIKWLYHSIARGSWHVDRLAWRLFTPHLSGAFSFALLSLIFSGVFNILDRQTLQTSPAIVGLGFLLGYFSDFTVARLAKLARDLLGVHHNASSHPQPDEHA